MQKVERWKEGGNHEETLACFRVKGSLGKKRKVPKKGPGRENTGNLGENVLPRGKRKRRGGGARGDGRFRGRGPTLEIRGAKKVTEQKKPGFRGEQKNKIENVKGAGKNPTKGYSTIEARDGGGGGGGGKGHWEKRAAVPGQQKIFSEPSVKRLRRGLKEKGAKGDGYKERP